MWKVCMVECLSSRSTSGRDTESTSEKMGIVILLGGSSKKRQSVAIAAAQAVWAEYKRRKGAKEN